MNLSEKLKAIKREIVDLERLSGDSTSNRGRKAKFTLEEVQLHLDDLEEEKRRLEKQIKKSSRLDLPDFCFNHKKVDRFLRGMPL